MPNPRSILVFRIGLLGDTLVALPAIEAIRTRFPGARLVLLTSRVPDPNWISTWDVLRGTGWFDEVVFYDAPSRSFANFVRIARMALALRRRRFDYAFALAPLRGRWQAWRDRFFFRRVLGIAGSVLGPPASLSHRQEARAGFTAEKEGLRLLRLVEPRAREADVDRFRLTIPQRDQSMAARALAEHGVQAGERLVAIAPGARIDAKRWPERRYHEAGAALLSRHLDVRLVAIGGVDDAALCAALCAAWGVRSFNLAGRLSVHGSAAVLARCAVYVGNDSGPMHLAAAVGTPCVAIFSAREVRGRWHPAGEGHVILREHTECAGCMLEECELEGLRCLEAISVDNVVCAALAQLDAHRERETAAPRRRTLAGTWLRVVAG